MKNLQVIFGEKVSKLHPVLRFLFQAFGKRLNLRPLHHLRLVVVLEMVLRPLMGMKRMCIYIYIFIHMQLISRLQSIDTSKQRTSLAITPSFGSHVGLACIITHSRSSWKAAAFCWGEGAKAKRVVARKAIYHAVRPPKRNPQSPNARP